MIFPVPQDTSCSALFQCPECTLFYLACFSVALLAADLVNFAPSMVICQYVWDKYIV